MMSDIADRLRRVVREHLGVETDKIVDDADIMDDLGADEFDLIELVMAFEEELGVEVPPDVAKNIYSFGDAVRVFSSDAVKPFFSDPE